jgi:hypothetical protein
LTVEFHVVELLLQGRKQCITQLSKNSSRRNTEPRTSSDTKAVDAPPHMQEQFSEIADAHAKVRTTLFFRAVRDDSINGCPFKVSTISIVLVIA